MEFNKTSYRIEKESERREVRLVILATVMILGIAVGLLGHYYFIGQYL